jgi:SRSO17 transposase
MIVDLEKVKFKKLESREMFEFIYMRNVQNGNWKERTEEEKDKIFENYQVLEVEGTIL